MASSVPPSMVMQLAVAGIGLVSPNGRGATPSVFFTEGSVEALPPSPFAFQGPDDPPEEDPPPIDVRWCGWIPATQPIAQRLTQLALDAAGEALTPLAPELRERDLAASSDGIPDTCAGIPLYLCVADERPGWTRADRDELERALRAKLRPSSISWMQGEAGAMAALVDIAKKGRSPALIVGVDSYVSPAAAARSIERPVSDWEPLPPPLSEGAAALLVGSRQLGRPMATIVAAGSAMGKAHDDNDEPLDGLAMTYLLATLPEGAPFQVVYGQDGVSMLRSRDWEVAAGRHRHRLASEYETIGVEGLLGRLGAAAGVASMAYAIESIRGGLLEISGTITACCWMISPDGLRGLAVLRGEEQKR